MRAFGPRMTDWILAWRLPLLVMGIAVGAAAAFQANELSFDQSIETMFSSDDPLIEPYQKLKRTFGGNEIVMAVYADDGLLDEDAQGIRRLAAVCDRLLDVPGVEDVIGLHQPLGEHIVDPTLPQAARIRWLLEGYTHSADGRIAGLVCILTPESETRATRRETINAIREIISEQPSGMIAGEPVMVVDGFQYIEQDGQRLGRVSTLRVAVMSWECCA